MANLQGHYHKEKTTVEAPDTEYTLKKEREKNGQCPDCGIQTYKIKHVMFSGEAKIPITNDKVISGRCLECKPLRSSAFPIKLPGLGDSDSVIDPDEPLCIEIPTLTNADTVSSMNQSDMKIENSTGFLSLKTKLFASLGTLIIIAIGIALYFAIKPPPHVLETTTTTTSSTILTTPSNEYDKDFDDGVLLGTKVAEDIWREEGSSCSNIWSSFEMKVDDYLAVNYPTNTNNWRTNSYHDGIHKGSGGF